MSESFHRLLFPGTCHVLGRALPPLSLWSLSILQAVGSPFLSTDAGSRFTLSDLQLAVRCACIPALQPPDLRPRLRDWWLHRRRHRNEVYLIQHATAFQAWLDVHQRLPELWQQESEAQPRYISAPLPLSHAAALLALGMTHQEAWSCSPGYATWLILAHGERSSDSIRFSREEEAAFAEELAANDLRSEAEILAQAKADLPPQLYERWVAARNNPPSTL